MNQYGLLCAVGYTNTRNQSQCRSTDCGSLEQYSQYARSSRELRLIGPWLTPGESGDGAQTRNVIVCRACSASRVYHLGSLVLGHSPSDIVVQELTATISTATSRRRRQELIDAFWSLIHRIAVSPRRCCESFSPRAGRVWACARPLQLVCG